MARLVRSLVACAAALLLITGSASAGDVPRAVLAPPATGLYHAAFPGFGGSEDSVTAARLAAFERKAGKHVAWAYFSQNWWKGVRFPGAAVAAIRSRGAVPFIRLMPRSGDEQNVAERRFTLQRIAGGAFDADLARWADGARDSGGPLLVEFGTEVNGVWFPWNGKWNGHAQGAELFRRAYRHIVEIFRREGASDVIWFFHVTSISYPDAPWNTMAAYYPGDDYVDWIGVSVYGAADRDELAEWPTFRQIMDGAYRELTALSVDKPLAILELGVAEDPERPRRKATWIRGAYKALAAGAYPRVKAVAWWNERFTQDDGFVTDLRINSSPAALAAYRQAVAGPLLLARAQLSTG